MNELQAIDHVWEVLDNKKIILYGASGGGRNMFSVLQDAGIPVTMFCDSDTTKAGTLFCGIPVISKDELRKYNGKDEYCIIISSCYAVEIDRDLRENIKWQGDCFTSFAIGWGLWFSMQEEKKVPPHATAYWKKKKLYNLVERVCYNTISSRISGLNYWTIESILFKKDPYVVFQPAKVGSSSICVELDQRGKNIIHLHDIKMFFKEHPTTDEEKQTILEAIRNVPNLKIITGVRDPIARDISLTFEELTHGSCTLIGEGGFLTKIYERTIGNTPLCEEGLPPIFGWNKYIRTNSKYGAMFDWFDREIKEFFNIDIFEEEFDREKGYSVIKKDNIEIFVYKLENLNKPDLNQALKQFLGIDDFDIQHSNNSEEKNYSICYRQVLQEMKLGQDYLDFYYKDNPRMKHFYTEEEIKSFRSRWERNT